MTSAGDRMRRLLALLPWVAANEGPSVEEVCTRFGIKPKDLLRDIQLVQMVGVPPYGGGNYFDVVVEKDRVWVHFAPSFDRSLRLTPEEGLSLLAAGAGILATPGADASGALGRGLAKLAGVLNVTIDEAIGVDIKGANPEVLAAVQNAAAERQQLDIDYYTHSRDERTVRRINPYRLFHDRGAWYLVAFDHRRDDERVFRVDRVLNVTPTTETFTAPPAVESLGVFEPKPDDPRVVIEVDAGADWIAESYPVEALEEGDGDRLRVTLAVSAAPWLERLLLSLGPRARVVEVTGDASLAECGAAAARRILARYGASEM